VSDDSSLLSSCDIPPDTLSEEPCSHSLKSCNDSLTNTDGHQEAISELRIIKSLGLNEKEEQQEVFKLATIQAEHVECEKAAVPALTLSNDDRRQEVSLETGHSPVEHEKEKTATLRTEKPNLALMAGPTDFWIAEGITTPLAADGFDSGMDEASNAKCPSAGNECSNYSTEDSPQDDESLCSQSNASTSASDALDGTAYFGSALEGDEVLLPILETAKRALVIQLMQEVWGIFDKYWTAKYTACAGSTPTSSSPSRDRASNSDNRTTRKRQRQKDDNGNSSEENNGRAPQGSPPNRRSPSDGKERLELSCPFRKHDHRKYRFPKYKSCARSSWDSVGRVK
jgi:hypothetical protein